MVSTVTPSRLDRYAAAILRRRWLVAALATLLMLVVTGGARFIGVTNDYRSMFAEDNPQLTALDALEQTFSASNAALIAVAPRRGSVFTRETLGAVEELTEAAWGTPWSTRVDSLTNYSHSEAIDDDLVVEPLVDYAQSLGDADLARVEEIALNAIDLAGRLVAHDGRVAGVVINFALPENPDAAVVEITDYLDALLDEARASHPDVAYHLTGDVVMNRAFAKATEDDFETLAPIVFLVIVVATTVLLRSLLGALALVITVVFVINTTMGFAGWIGTVFNPANSGVPIIVMTVAVAHSVHIVTATLAGMSRGLGRNEAVAESLRGNAWPVFLTTITTAIGFLSLNASDSPPFHVLGNLVAFGVLCAFVYSMTLLPALLSLLPLRAPRARTGRVGFFAPVPIEQPAFFDRFGAFVVDRRRFLLGFVALLAAGLALGIPRIELTDNWTQYFDERYEFRRDTDFVINNLTGMETLEYSLNAGREGGITDPDYLRAVDAFAEWYRGQPEVAHVQAFPDIMKRLNRNMHGDDPAFHRLPDDPALTAQYLLLYELSLPFGNDLNNRIDVAKSATRMTVVVHSLTSKAQRELDARAQDWLRANAPRSCNRGVGGQHRLRSPFPAKHQQHAAGHDYRHGPHFADPDRGLQEPAPGSHQPRTQFSSRRHELRPVGLPGRPGGSRRLGGHRDGVRHHRGRHDSFPGQVSRSPPRRARRAGGGALRLSHRGAGAVDHDRDPVAGLPGVCLLGIRAELGARPPHHDHDRFCAPRRFPASPALADGHRSEKVMIRPRPARSALRVLAACLAYLACLGAPVAADAATPEEIGLEIAVEARERKQGFGNFTASQTMVLRNKQGQESRRRIRVKVPEVEGDGDRSMFVFDKPRDVKGTALLIHAHKEEADDQWLYLPALKRVKRISSSNRSGSFMGSEFAYEDMSPQEVEKFTYRYLRDEPCGELTCTVSELFPEDRKSGYRRQIVWRDKDELRVWKVEYFDRKDAHLKTLTMGSYAQYLDRYWQAGEMTMVNHLTGKSTVLSWADFEFRTDLNPRDFTKTGLKRAR